MPVDRRSDEAFPQSDSVEEFWSTMITHDLVQRGWHDVTQVYRGEEEHVELRRHGQPIQDLV